MALAAEKQGVSSLPSAYYIWVMNEMLTVRLGKELAHTLRAEARQSGMTRGEIVRQALKTRLGQNGKLSVMRRYFGAMEGPPDLSANKSYRGTWELIMRRS
jgi:hypothetical protein